MSLPPQIESRLRSLPSKRRRVVVEKINGYAHELIAQAANEDNLGKLEAVGQASVDTLDLLMLATARQLERYRQLLADVRAAADPEQMELEDLEASGRLQVLELYREVEEASLSVAELEEAGIQRQRLKQLRDQGRLLGIQLPFRRGFLYPRWQFGRDLRPKEFLAEVLRVAGEKGLDPLSVHRLMTHAGSGGGTTPLELCEQGQTRLALNALHGTGEVGG